MAANNKPKPVEEEVIAPAPLQNNDNAPETNAKNETQA